MRHTSMKIFAVLAALTCFLTAAGCTLTDRSTSETASSETASAETTAPADSESSADTTAVNADALSQSALESKNYGDLSKWDTKTDWDDDAVTVTLSGDSAEASASEGISIADGVITITKGGSYVFSGKLNDGRILVNLTDKTEKVQIVLNGAEISCSTSSPLTVLQADKAVITLADGTENSLTDAAEYTVFDLTDDADGDGFPGACIASKDDLTINGSGSLTVTGNYNNGIHCTDDLKLVGGKITVKAANHGVRGNESVLLIGAVLDITAEGDGIKTTAADTDGKGYVCVASGSATINAAQDGVDSVAEVVVLGGNLDIITGGGSKNAAAHTDDMFGGGMPGGFGGNFDGFGENGGFGGRGGFGKFGGSGRNNDLQNDDSATDKPAAAPTANVTAEENTDSSQTVSTKGIKSDTVILMTGGSVTADSASDALHSNGEALISGNAELTLKAGDDGIHADDSLSIAGSASVSITESYEGIESAEINISGGETRIQASDDGINASGAAETDTNASGTGSVTAQNTAFGNGGGFFRGGMGFGNGSGELNISGGYLYVNANGDGLDSNGNITMTGGTVVVCGPTNDGNGSLDSGDNNNAITVTGGTLIAVGSTGMMEVPEENYLAATDLNAAADTLIVVTDDSGKVLAALQTPKQAKGIVVSADGMSDGYHIYTGGKYTGTLNDDGFGTGGSYSGGTEIASGSGGAEGFGGFGGMQPPDGFDGSMPDFDGSMPDFDGMQPPEGFDGQMPDDFNGQMPPQGGRRGGASADGSNNANENTTSRLPKNFMTEGDDALL